MRSGNTAKKYRRRKKLVGFPVSGLGVPAGCVLALVVDPQNSGNFYAVFRGGGVFKSVDGGATWNGPIQGSHPMRKPWQLTRRILVQSMQLRLRAYSRAAMAEQAGIRRAQGCRIGPAGWGTAVFAHAWPLTHETPPLSFWGLL